MNSDDYSQCEEITADVFLIVAFMFYRAADMLAERNCNLQYWQRFPVRISRIYHVSTKLPSQINILNFAVQGVIHHLNDGGIEFYRFTFFSKYFNLGSNFIQLILFH